MKTLERILICALVKILPTGKKLEKLIKVLAVFFVIGAVLGWIMDSTIGAFIKIVLWFIINLLEVILIIPFGVWFLFTGNFYGYRMEKWVDSKTNGYFAVMYTESKD